MDKIVIAISLPQSSAPKQSGTSYDEAVKKFMQIEGTITADKMRQMLKFLDTLRNKEENQAGGIDTNIDTETEANTPDKHLFE